MATLIARTGPTVRLSAKDDAAAAADRVVLNPGCVDGELLIGIQSQTAGTEAAMTAPSTLGEEWTQRGATGGSGTVGWMKVWVRVASNEGASWTFGGDGNGNVVVLVLPNWDTRGGDYLWDVEPTFNTGTADASQDSPSITMVRATNRLIRAWANETGGAGHDGAGGTYVEHQDSLSATNTLSVQSQETAGAGTTGTQNANVTGAGAVDFVSVAFAISSPPDTASALYAPSVLLPKWSTAGNGLVVCIAANSEGASTADDCKVSSVIDDAHNIWHVATDGVDTADVFQVGTDTDTSIRGAIWYVTNAQAITRLTVTMTQICDSIAIEIYEWNGLGNTIPVVDKVDTSVSAANTTITTNDTTTTAQTVIVAMGATGDTAAALANSLGAGFTAGPGGLVATDSQVTTQDDTQLITAYRDTSSAAAYTTTFTVGSAQSLVALFVAFKEAALVTTNGNANWPAIVHELGFGYDPNDAATAIVYTDVTTRVQRFACQRGRDYELARTEAGECETGLNNYDGRFDPTNASGTYYPNVKVLTPYRIRVTWSGILYDIFTGYVERWPQKWDQQRGVSRLQVIDGLATLAGTRLAGALGAEILADDPWAYWPLSDGRLSEQAANKATTTSTPLSIVTSTSGGGSGSFGATLALQGEDSTCWLQNRLSSNVYSATSPYGKCLSAGMDLPQFSDGILVEVWAKIEAFSPVEQFCLIALKAEGFSAEANRRAAVLHLDTVSGLPTIYVMTSAAAFQVYSATASGYNDGNWHHYVMHLTTTRANLWVDGTQRVTDGVIASVSASAIDRIEFGGEIDTWSNNNIAEGSFAHAAVFELATVDARRIAARANAGLFGFPERSGARITRLLNYIGWAGGRAIDEGQSFLGAANTIPRQTLLAAVQDISGWENGLTFVDSSGQFRFVDRATRFNQSVKWVFGEAAGEIPYESDVEIEYDPKYVFNDVTITKSAGRLATGETVAGGSSAHQKDQASIAAYFTRNLDKTSGVSSVGQLDNEATWVIENYAEPRPRLARISITPSANPDLWETALSVEIGDRVLVRRQPFGGADIELDCYIEQVGHQVKPNEWKVVLTLSPALLTTYGAQNEWILNSSILDVDTIVGS